MHIVLVISSLGAGGAERVLSELANHWASKGHKVSLMTLAAPDVQPFYPLDSKVQLIQLNQSQRAASIIGRLKSILLRILCLRKTIVSLKPDVILSFVDVMNLTTLLASAGLKIPVIVSERIDPHFHPIPKFYKIIRRLLYYFANKVIVQTNSASTYFAKNLQSIIKIIPNPVMKPKNHKVLHPTVKFILTIGRLNAQKDHATLIQAFARLHPAYPYLRLTIFGEGAERQNLQHLINSLNLQEKVSLPGTTQDIHKKLLEADLFVFPSLYEGFPNALCEAMAIGLPVIASNCSGNVDVVRDNVDGRLFPVGDVKALTAIMEELLNDAAQTASLALKAQEIVERFHPVHILKLWDQLIEQAVNRQC